MPQQKLPNKVAKGDKVIQRRKREQWYQPVCGPLSSRCNAVDVSFFGKCLSCAINSNNMHNGLVPQTHVPSTHKHARARARTHTHTHTRPLTGSQLMAFRTVSCFQPH
ncbi:unnamed protein product [Ectocarpus sp. 8 AP-2014]